MYFMMGLLPSSSMSDQSSPLSSSSTSLPSSSEASSSNSLSSSSLSSSNASSLISNSEADSLWSDSSSDSTSRNFQPPSLKNCAGSSLTVFIIVVQLRFNGPSEKAISHESSQLLTLSRCSIGMELI